MSEPIQDADIKLTREEAYIIVEGLKNTSMANGVMVKDLPALLLRIHQLMQKVSAPFVEKEETPPPMVYPDPENITSKPKRKRVG